MKRRLLVAAMCTTVATVLAQVRPTDFASVKSCKSLGEIQGSSHVCSAGSARANAMKKATAAGATHIVWTNSRCVFFVGDKVTGEMFDCNAKPSNGNASNSETQEGTLEPLGLYVMLVPPELRASLKRNTGAYVKSVADRSPAFFANILPGDVIVRTGSMEVRTPEDLNGLKPGDELVVLRDGKEISIRTR